MTTKQSTTKPIEDFGDDPEAFDLDQWIDQGSRPRREVTVYPNGALLEEYDRLTRRLEEADADDEAMGEEGADAIRAQIAELLERMSAGARTFTLQALTQQEVKALAEAAPTMIVDLGDGHTREKVDEVALGDATVAASIIRPSVTAEQIARMRDRMGDGAVMPLYRATYELQNAGQVLPTVPSSREY